MKTGLLSSERIVLESLGLRFKNLDELHEDTGLEKKLLVSITRNLILMALVKFQKGYYSIEESQRHNWERSATTTESIKREVSDVFVQLMNAHFKNKKAIVEREVQQKNCLKLRKVWLSPKEEKLLNVFFHDIERFLEETERLHGDSGRICERRVIIWGHSTYGELLTDELSSLGVNAS
jgi:hypothetical protein